MPQSAVSTLAKVRTVRAGLVGRGILLSRTPAMHEAEGRAHGMDYDYRLFDLDDQTLADLPLSAIIESAEAEGLAGLNVTYPFKFAVIEFLHELSDNARAVGAVNTIVFRDGRRIGHNTDLWGFAEAFRRGMAGVSLEKVLLIGAGGAGVAVSRALLSLGVARLWIFEKDEQRATALVRVLQDRFGPDRAVAAENLIRVAPLLNGVVNATPVGMEKCPGSPYPAMLLRADLWVADIVYFPLETELLAAARAAGCRVLPGSDMAVFQAARAFNLFTGESPDPARMRRTFEALGP